MPKAQNPVWRFFASVKLALTTLVILAVTSIVGTLIEQGLDQSYYIQEYGPNLARLFAIFDFTDMYSSWWYVALLCLFAINLIICSIERLPGAWHLVMLDNLAIDPGKLEKMNCVYRADSSLPARTAAERMSRMIASSGWKHPRRKDCDDGSILLFAQRGAWTRLGVYVVHLSILIILLGAILGTFFGMKAYVYLAEGRSTDTVFLQEGKEPVPLGFTLQFDRFEKAFYPNGMIKELRSDLAVFDPDNEKSSHKSIVVNDPLAYRGFTFYQGDSYPLDEFFVIIRNETNGMEQAFRAPPERDAVWKEAGASFRIEELKRDQEGALQKARISFATEAAAEPSIFWLGDKDSVTIQQPGGEFTFSLRQLYSTLLLVTRDPGVWVVYLGFILMIAGLAIVFFMSHQRLWIEITTREGQASRLLVSATSNKNKIHFKGWFQELVEKIGEENRQFN